MKRGKKLIQLVSSKKKKDEFRKKYWKKQNEKCAILKQRIDLKEAVVDHCHKLKKQKPGPNGRGLVRGILHFQVNSLEGVIVKKYKRYGVDKLIPLPEFLRNLASYLECPPIPQKYIHWTEKPKAPILKKSDYNRIRKYYFLIHPRAKKIPPYPKNGIKKTKSGIKYKAKMTKKWKILLKKANKIHQKK